MSDIEAKLRAMIESGPAWKRQEAARQLARAIHTPGPPQYPSLPRQAANLAASLGRWAWSGFRVVAVPLYRSRRATCRACPHLDGARCTKCGCLTALKPWLASERCPDGRW